MVSRRMMSAVFMLAVVTSAQAATYDGLGIEYWAGSEQGQNQATVVIDFGFEQFAFGYKWDGAATGWDALSSISSTALPDKLNVYSTDYGPGMGIFINDISYLDAVKFDYGQMAYASWAYFNSVDGTNWTEAGGSSQYRNLDNGSWDCFIWTEWSFSPFGPLRQPGQMPVPEPASLALLALGGLMIRRRNA